MADKTLFQKIADGDIPSEMLYEDDVCFAIRDINPQAPVHFLVIPRRPIPTLNHLEKADEDLVGHLFTVAAKLAMEEELTDGYRTVFNCGRHGQQTVNHLHLHVLGGRQLKWPPG
ncbi:MAG: histidine triad nucleotide-binding protein [Rhodothermales bacterium]|nr:histidine triad nucleotide-binding protein [Rhodothermales bacterium]